MEILQFFKLIYKDTYLLIGAIFIIAGCIVSGSYFTKTKINSKSDLVEINSTLQDYSFKQFPGSKGHTIFSYFIYLGHL